MHNSNTSGSSQIVTRGGASSVTTNNNFQSITPGLTSPLKTPVPSLGVQPSTGLTNWQFNNT